MPWWDPAFVLQAVVNGHPNPAVGSSATLYNYHRSHQATLKGAKTVGAIPCRVGRPFRGQYCL